MTEKSKSAIGFLTRYKGCQYEIEPNECCQRECSECEYNFDVRTAQKYIETAIRSLKAWEEVLQELEHDKEICFAHDSDEGFVYARVIDTINQKLAEIEERN